MQKYPSKTITMTKIKLQDFADIKSGVFLTGFPQGEVAYLQVKDIANPNGVLTATRLKQSSRTDQNLLKKGDLLFAGKGTSYVCRIFDWDIPAVASTALYAIRLRNNIATPEYLCWYLNHPSVVAKIKAGQVGSGTPMVHKSTLEELEIAVPSMEKQNLIVKLSLLQDREQSILHSIAEKRLQLSNQIIINEINK